MVNIKLPDGSVKEYPEGVRPREIAEGIGRRLVERTLVESGVLRLDLLSSEGAMSLDRKSVV